MSTLNGTAGDDLLNGTSGNDAIYLGDGDDVGLASAGDDLIDGGAGIDCVMLSGARNGFAVEKTPGGLSVTDNTGSQGIDTLSNVERIIFNDTALAFDTGGIAGQIYRLYQAAFHRTPDLPGLGSWMNCMDKGVMSLTGSCGC